ncbi:SAM-dependent methyltransferase [Kitasatospora sp. NPDC089913]|uniref:SAM-dependent methyltransferase n=1 Tax=Kitasatospora sp. NPDC089913 TaxID=3364080 RepID=UPI0037FF655C
MATDGERDDGVQVDLQLHRAHSARMYDYYLGGTTNFAPDREAAGQALAVFPWAALAARINRAFMHRSIRLLAARGFGQFLDIGTGIPTSPNLHEIAQGVNPGARVLYTDNDPIVLAHAQALLHSDPAGRTAYLEGDVLDPKAVLESDELHDILDLARPVVLSLVALLHFVPDDREARSVVEQLKAALAPGSALVISHGTPEFAPAEAERVARIYGANGTPVRMRTREEIARFFDGWEFLPPGLVATRRWRPEPTDPGPGATDAEASAYAGVAVKP